MAVTSGFFNSINHDRLYDAEQLSSIFDGIIADGVYENYGNAFHTKPSTTSFGVIVSSGRAWFSHTWTLNDSDLFISLESSHSVYDRIDFIVIDIDKRHDARSNSIKVVKGVEGVDPTPPVLINESDHKQYPIAEVTVPHSENILSQSNIRYTVGTDECPIVTSFLEAQNLENLYKQLESEFNEWWDGIKGVLDSDTVLKLQNQINELKEDFENFKKDNSVNEDGSIGNFIIPFTKEMYKGYAIKNYDPVGKQSNRYISSIIEFDLSNNANDYKMDDVFPYFILPDGYILALSSYISGASSDFLSCKLYNTESVLVKSLKVSTSVWQYVNRCVWIKPDVSTYPVTVIVGVGGVGYTGSSSSKSSNYYLLTHAVITVDDEHNLIQNGVFEDKHPWPLDKEMNINDSGESEIYNYSDAFGVMDDGSLFFGIGYSTSINAGTGNVSFFRMAKLQPGGTIQLSNEYKTSKGYAVHDNDAYIRIYNNLNRKYPDVYLVEILRRYQGRNNKLFTIDPVTMDILEANPDDYGAPSNDNVFSIATDYRTFYDNEYDTFNWGTVIKTRASYDGWHKATQVNEQINEISSIINSLANTALDSTSSVNTDEVILSDGSSVIYDPYGRRLIYNPNNENSLAVGYRVTGVSGSGELSKLTDVRITPQKRMINGKLVYLYNRIVRDNMEIIVVREV